MNAARIEVLVEPFKENDPGPHVHAVVAAMDELGLAPDMGPFATTATGDIDVVVSAVRSLLEAGFAAGASAIQVRVERS